MNDTPLARRQAEDQRTVGVEPDEQAVIEFSLEQLPDHVEKLLFLAGYRRTSFGSAEQEAASVKAAQPVRPGQRVAVRRPGHEQVLEVVQLLTKRVGAPVAAKAFYRGPRTGVQCLTGVTVKNQ